MSDTNAGWVCLFVSWNLSNKQKFAIGKNAIFCTVYECTGAVNEPRRSFGNCVRQIVGKFDRLSIATL